jgi:hypothetical protein
MPKVYLTETARRDAHFVQIMDEYRKARGISKNDLRQAVGYGRSQWTVKYHNPHTFSAEDITAIWDTLEIPRSLLTRII